MNLPIKAVLFDVDGTLLETTELVYQGIEHAIEAHSLKPRTRAEILELMHLRFDSIFEHPTDPVDIRAIVETYDAFQLNNLHLSQAFVNTLPVLEFLKEEGIKMAAVSNRELKTLSHSLELAGVNQYFTTVITPDIAPEKPNPTPLLMALEKLAVKPEEALMVGDSEADILAGVNAGVKTVGVAYGFHGDDIYRFNPNYVVHDIEEILPIILGKQHIESAALVKHQTRGHAHG